MATSAQGHQLSPSTPPVRSRDILSEGVSSLSSRSLLTGNQCIKGDALSRQVEFNTPSQQQIDREFQRQEINRSLLTCFILLESGESLEVEGLSPNTTVKELKETIRDLDARFPLQSQWLSYAGAPLVGDKTLSDYRIKNLCVINLDKYAQRKGVMRKPVILLYPPSVLEEVSVRVRLASDMRFSALYPKPYNARSGEQMCCEWRVRASPSSSLTDLKTGKEHPYLVWEATTPGGKVARRFNLSKTPSFCVPGDTTGNFLEDALTRLGLNAHECCDMITYWLVQLEASPFNAIQFVDAQYYARSAELDITPAPDVVIRIFMVFRGLRDYDANLDTANLDDLRSPARQGFVAVQWGGMSLNRG